MAKISPLTYDPAMGDIDLTDPQTVVIAGKPRERIVHVDAGVEAAYEHHNRVEESRKTVAGAVVG